MTESELQKEIIAYLKVKECLVFRMNSGYIKSNVRLAPPGTPDLLVVPPAGFSFWVEVKTPTGKLRESQIEMIDKLKQRNQTVWIVRSMEEIGYII